VIDLRALKVAMARIQRVGPLAKLLPLVVGSVLVTWLATAASPEPTGWFFQSPLSPVSPVSPIGLTPEGSPAAPEGTVAGPGLVAVPAAPNLVPWLVGIILVAAIVGAAMLWSRRRGKGEGSA
jgi:amino acid transporter